MSDAIATAVGYSIIPIMIMTLLAIIAYMFSRFIKRPEWIAFAKEEGLQVIFSIILIFVVVAGTQFVYSTVNSMTGNDPFTGATEYILTVEKDAIDGFRWFFTLKFGVSLMSAATVPLDPVSVIVGHIPIINNFIELNAKRPFMDVSTLNRATDYITLVVIYPMFSSLVAQKIGLSIFKMIMFPFVLPIGLFLRVFPGSRNAGALMVAVALAFHIVFPTTYLLNGYVYDEMRNENAQLMQNAIDDSLANPFTNPIASTMWTISTAPIKEAIRYVVVPVLNWLALLILAGMFLPLLSIIITITFIRSMQKIIILGFG